MRAITLYQPYAQLIADGRKRFETRSWAPPRKLIGQRIAIHAGKFEDRIASAEFGYRHLSAVSNTPDDIVPTGVVLCTAILRGAYRSSGPLDTEGDPTFRLGGWVPGSALWGEVDGHPGYREDDYGDYSFGRWIWWLTDIEVLDPPVEAKGHQGFWEWKK